MGVPGTKWSWKQTLVSPSEKAALVAEIIFPLEESPSEPKIKYIKKPRLYGFWSEERKAELRRYWEAGLTDDEISGIMLRTARGISTQRSAMGLVADRGRPCINVIEPLAPVKFPQFENITKAEAREVTKGIPPSGRIFRAPDECSYTGNSAAMCVGIGK